MQEDVAKWPFADSIFGRHEYFKICPSRFSIKKRSKSNWHLQNNPMQNMA
jgi:hypothetical protein